MTITRRQQNDETNEPNSRSIGHGAKKKALETCQQIYSKELSEDEGRVWREALQPIPAWIVREAFKMWTWTEKFFPKPSQILEMAEQLKGKNTIEFRACEKNGCIDGWVRIFEGKTVGGHDIDKKTGAAVRCICWKEWAGQA